MSNGVPRRITVTCVACLLLAATAGCGDDPVNQTENDNRAEHPQNDDAGDDNQHNQSDDVPQNQTGDDDLNAGQLDPSFGDEGTVTVDTGTDSRARDLLVRDDDSVILVGWSDYKDGREITLVGLTAQGSPDHSFGDSGMVRLSIDDDTGTVPRDAAMDADGNVVVAGSAVEGGLYSGGDRHRVLARFDKNGTLDDSFGQDGLVLEPEPDDETGIRALTVQPSDNRIVAGGSYHDADSGGFTLWGYDETGAPDETFGDDGAVRTELSPDGDGTARELETQSDGSIVAAGYHTPGEDDERFLALTRYRPDGTLDSSFGDDGFTETPVETSEFSPHVEGLAIDEDDRLAVCGQLPYFAARYGADGRPDPDFGDQGLATVDVGTVGSGQGLDCLVSSDGHLVQTGEAQAGGTFPNSDSYTTNFGTIRYGPDGTIDETFGDDGLATNEFSGGTSTTPAQVWSNSPTAGSSSAG